jgi:hypothetical protein
VEGVVGDVVGLLQVFVVHLRDVGRILQYVVGIPPDVMDFAENIITSPRSLKSDEMGTHPDGRHGICRKHSHDSNVFEEFLSLICRVYSLRFAEFTLGFGEFTLRDSA